MLKEELIAAGADRAEILPVSGIPFEPSLLSLCAENRCGNYNKCWTCPPLNGKIEELIAAAKKHKSAYVFQKIYKIEDSFDIEGMFEANRKFQKIILALSRAFTERNEDCLLLGAGGCRICSVCAAAEGKPCRHPELACPSLESYGIQVSELAARCGMKYINGASTITYFGAVLK